MSIDGRCVAQVLPEYYWIRGETLKEGDLASAPLIDSLPTSSSSSSSAAATTSPPTPSIPMHIGNIALEVVVREVEPTVAASTSMLDRGTGISKSSY